MDEDDRETRLSPEDQIYWDSYMNSKEAEEEIEDFATLLDQHEGEEKKPPLKREESKKKPLFPPPKPDKKSQIDRRIEDKLRKGKLPIERIYDLHGLRQEAAYEALEKFVLRSFQAKCRCVLVITGKGREKMPRHWIEESKGILKRKVPEWLSSQKFDPYVLKVLSAHQKHGGQGAYYIYLKRNY
jgi:DNA-nicking Smr family endonuclease